jgi:GTP-binding protein
MKFIDEVVIQVFSGAGGAGHVSFRREKYVPRGGPDGGDGGAGGAVIFYADSHRNTLIDYRRKRHWRAGDGVPGGKKQMYGHKGTDCMCAVPVGTMIFDDATGQLLADLAVEGEQFEIPGGRGGLGNMHFRSSTNRTPRQSLPPGPPEERTLRLELRLLADVGLLGFPNAGKSTLLSRLSAARPKIADYPFTTITPQLGVVELGDRSTFVLADVPGLIEGAAEGAGLGHQFLRHLERCGCYIHLLSPESEDETEPVERYVILMEELARFGAGLDQRPQVVVINKIDLLDAPARARLKRELQALTDHDVHLVSGVTGEGLGPMVASVWAILEAQREAGVRFEPVPEPHVFGDDGEDPATFDEAWDGDGPEVIYVGDEE